MGVWAWAAVMAASVVAEGVGVETNVVAEVPSLDVGPLLGVTVARGDVARLPCRHPHHPGDVLNLVLWYLDNTPRPFLSYDARSTSVDPNATVSGTGHGVSVGVSVSGVVSDPEPSEVEERRFLEFGGTNLVIRRAAEEDEAEYRCRVHYRFSPTWTQRLFLLVSEAVEDVTLEYTSGDEVEGRLETLAEGDNLTLVCRASHDASRAVVDLSWLLEGRELDSSWADAGGGVAVNQLQVVGVEPGLRGAHVSCRLTTADGPLSAAANITYRSANIAMFYVPEAVLGAEGGRVGATGGWREVQEGARFTLLCNVHADPPVYNITWLHNGRVVGVGGRRWMRDNASLVVSPVERGDAGLYTCLASNREGDGHSNAILIRVTHLPYCTGSAQTHLVVPTNTSVNLTCRVEAVPNDLEFTWRVGSPSLRQEGVPPLPPLLPPPPPLPPRRSSHLDVPRGKDSWEILQGEVELEGQRDPRRSDQSTLTLTPNASTLVGCYARNSVGHIRVPCTYTLTVVEQPRALKECRVTLVGAARLQVKCEDPAHPDPSRPAHPGGRPTHPQHSPSLSFVRSPEASTRANLEVWSGETLVANVSEGRPQFSVRGLPPATDLRLVLYTATPHARSAPLYMYTRTLPRTVVHFTVPPPTRPTALEPEPGPPTALLGAVGWRAAGWAGLAGAVLLTALTAAVALKARRRPRAGDGGRELHLQKHDSLVTTASEESMWGPEWRSSSM